MLTIKRIVKYLLYLLVLVLCAIFLIMKFSDSKANLVLQTDMWRNYPTPVISPDIIHLQDSLPKFKRPVSNTYMTYPEWYIVYSAKEYADFLKINAPSSFPYFSSISQYWWSYKTINKIIETHFKNASKEQLMLIVIGTSFSLEYFLKGIYENTIGKITELLSVQNTTDEDIYAQRIANDYYNFVLEKPWFEFPFATSLAGLWSQTSLVGPYMIRKLERKFILSLEYSIKSIYALIIRIGSTITYGAADSSIYALANNIPNDLFQKNINIHEIKKINNFNSIVSLPSQQPFTETLIKVLNNNIKFINISGNYEILVTALAPINWKYQNKYGQLIFTMEVLTHPGLQRIALRVRTESLVRTLEYLKLNNAKIEHVYPY
ncbi:hypothetical protein N9L02_01055 [Gammaproteobacteria bacterium]|nr:hypothetical protein [Gammaproteobacteria bacterium]